MIIYLFSCILQNQSRYTSIDVYLQKVFKMEDQVTKLIEIFGITKGYFHTSFTVSEAGFKTPCLKLALE